MAHILVPTDFSPNALNAALYALELYGAEGNTFTILHCYMMPSGASTLLNLDDRLATASQQDLADFVTSLREKLPGSKHQVETRSERGFLPEVINVYKDRPNAPDVVIMGTQGATGIDHVLMGTNTADAIKRGGMPVLAVPAQALFTPLDKIILTDDGSPVDTSATRVLLDVVRRTGANVVVLRMINEEVALPAGGTPVCSFEAVLRGVPHTHVYLSGDDLTQVLDDHIHRSGAGMLAVVHRQRGWLQGLLHRSASARLAMHTNIPLLVLQQPGDPA